jgi:hypothetical protein
LFRFERVCLSSEKWEDEADEDEKDVTPKCVRYWLLVGKVDSVFDRFETLARRGLNTVAQQMGFPRSTVHGWWRHWSADPE